MKIWNECGSEHSMKFMMVGHFKTAKDAKDTKELIDKLSEKLRGKINFGINREHFSEDVMKTLQEASCFILSPIDLENFLYDFHTEVNGKKLVLTTYEIEVAAFFKLMIGKGAKVEAFSVPDYPDEGYGRGK